MRTTWSLALAALVAAAACGGEPAATTGTAAAALRIDPATDGTEPAFVNGRQCTMVFPGALTPSTEYYAIWAIGTKGIVDAPYDTPRRPNLYAVFGTHPAPGEIHHVPGFDEFDHYHVLDAPPGEDEVENKRWDLLVLVPGPNFDPATYVSARSAAEVLAQSAAGVLGPVSTPAIFGLPGLVLYSPVVCPEEGED
ncbi:MAG TPA: hypothetical protein VLD85_04685 [Anaeromyxobacteraceae bacterium]|nr:hypothetical protein [Anaeromyxobacteraceae bacterium]